MEMIPYGRQHLSEEDIQAVVRTLRSDYITQGPAIDAFERAVADYCGVKYAVAVSNGTSALHLACLAAGLKTGDRLWTTPNTFVASANCGRYCGADVDFVDIDPKTYNMSVDRLVEKLAWAEAQRCLPQVVVPVHFAGQSCQMERIAELKEKYGFTVIEDAAHALGGSYQGRKIGACAYSDMTTLSFHPVKIITSGEGGMILTNRDDLYEILLRLRSHGITRDPAQMQEPSHGGWYYEQLDLGFNDRMTDLQAALGASQMTRIDDFIGRRRTLAARYDEKLKHLPLKTPYQHPDTESAWHLYVVRLPVGSNPDLRREVFDELRAEGIGVHVHYIPVHTQPYYRELGFDWGHFPDAEQYYREALTLPIFYGMTDTQQDRVVTALEKVLASKSISRTPA